MASSPPTALAPHHIALKVRRLEPMERFYTDLLGLAVVKRWEDPSGALRSVWLACGSLLLMLERSAQDQEPPAHSPPPVAPAPVAPLPVAPPPVTSAPVAPLPVAPPPVTPAPVAPPPVTSAPFAADPAGWHLMAFAIPATSRSAWRTHLEQAGVLIVHHTAYSLYVQDPEGNRLALSHFPDAAEGDLG